MKITDRLKDIPSLWKTFRWVVLFFVVFTISGFLIVPPVAKYFLTKELSETLNRNVIIEDIDFNPYALSARISKFTVRDRDEVSTFLSFDELYVNMQIASVINKGVVLKEARLDGPYVNLVRHEGRTYNFSDLLAEEKSGKTSASEPLRFSLNNLQILNGSVDFMDTPKETKHEAREITVTIPMVSNMPYEVDIYVQPLFRAVVNGTEVSLGGRTKPFSDSLETVVNLNMEKLDIPHYLEYVPFPVNYKILSGTIDGKSSISYTQYPDRPAETIVRADITIQDLRVVDSSDALLIHLPLYTVRNVEADLSKKKVTVDALASSRGTIDVRRSKEGVINVQPQLPKLAEEIEEAAEKKEEKPWVVVIRKMAYDDFTITVEDRMPDEPVNLVAEDIDLLAEDISTEENSRGSLSYSLKLNKKGSVSAKSSIGINPVAANVSLNLKDIGLVPLQPYITDTLNVLITNGALSADGDLSYVTSGEGDLRADFKGKVSLSRFASLDKKTREDFLKWKSLYLNGIDFKLTPLNLRISEVALADFYSRLAINPDGSLNVQEIVKAEPSEDEAPLSDKPSEDESGADKKAPDTTIQIDRVTLQAGTISFSDKHISPNYGANLLEIGGRVTGLSSDKDSTATVDLRGKLENHAPLEITGTINPLGEDLSADIAVDFNDMDVSPLTPYSRKYVGYTVQKGKLSLGLKYLIVENKLDSQNKVTLDQFTLGERVDSPDATKLPVRLAIALLKNRKGEINLDLPVSGDLNDPKFSVSGVVLKLIKNILVKAATSPFALLGALVGGGQELSYIEFDYGSHQISSEGKAKLDKLTTALHKRPQLNMDITGYVDAENDREELRNVTFLNKLKAQKLREMKEKGQEGLSPDEITIAPEEYEEYLAKAYEKEDFPKPRDVFGVTKVLPRQEMEKLMLTYIVITDEDLRALASRRALAVKDYILQSGEVEQKRIFLVAPEALQPEKKEELRKSRVVFSLK